MIARMPVALHPFTVGPGGELVGDGPRDAVALDAGGAVALDAGFAALAAAGTRALRLTGLGPTAALRGLGALRELRHLEIVDDGVNGLPDELGGLGQLQTLRLETFNLLSLPRAIGRLRRLVALHVDSHRLDRLPRELTALVGLRAFGLALRDHHYRTARSRYFFYKARFRQPFVEVLGLLAALPALDTLYLSELTALPAELATLAALETLLLEDCRPITLPDEVALMPRLRRIEAHHTIVTPRPWLALAPGAPQRDVQVYRIDPAQAPDL